MSPGEVIAFATVLLFVCGICVFLPGCAQLVLFRQTGKLLREGVRVPSVVTRVVRHPNEPPELRFRYTRPDTGRTVSGREDWVNREPTPAVGQTVTVLHLRGWWFCGLLEANLRVAPRL